MLLCIFLCFGTDFVRATEGTAAVEREWLKRVVMKDGEGIIELPESQDPPHVFFLLFGDHSFEPATMILERKERDHWEIVGDINSIKTGKPLPIGLFQELRAVPWSIPGELFRKGVSYRFRVGRKEGVNGKPARDPFWDQIIVVRESAVCSENMSGLGAYSLVESGNFGDALPAHVKKISFAPQEIDKLRESLTDPVMDSLKKSRGQEMSWEELESMNFPLDYQKILLAGINDPDAAFAYQNGQWFVTWPGSDGSNTLSGWNRKIDNWFAPAIHVGNEIIRPAPLSAKTYFSERRDGRILPMIMLEWVYQSSDNKTIKVIQSMFSEIMDGIPQVFVRLKTEEHCQGASFVVGFGSRPYAHYWDDLSADRSPIPYFTSKSKLRKKYDHIITDETESVVLRSSAPVRFLHDGISETLFEFDADHSEVLLSTPQVRTKIISGPVTGEDFQMAEKKFREQWDTLLSEGAYADLPSVEWKRKIDSWLAQVLSITRIQYDGKEQLSYGAYFYKAYFGVEEGWPSVALAQWGRREEAKRQAEILLSGENLDRNNYHHQYRNGLSSWYAASVASLNGDRDWFRRISASLVANGYWTMNARRENEEQRSPLGRGLLPSHIYGGDVSIPAYSIYSNGTCLKGLIETANVFRVSGIRELQQPASEFEAEAVNYKKRLTEVMHEVLNVKSSPVFLPLALEMEHRAGNHEVPYNRLTEDKLGNYWNLFAPLFLHLEILRYKDPERPSEWITDYLENHGGLYAGLPRFYSGLDAVYAIGYIHEMLERAKADIGCRIKAITALESYMIHASSGNGHTVPEVSGFFPERLDRKDYERVVREAPWSFGMYIIDRYLRGYSSFTEPLGAGAGEGLWLIRKSLVDEGRDENGLPDGSIFFLSAIPGEWLKEGKEIRLLRFPTAYGTFDLYVRSFISSKREIHVQYNYSRTLAKDQATGREFPAWHELEKIFIRLVPSPGDIASGLILKPGPAFTLYDPWTVQLPIKEKGDFIIRF